MIGRRELLAGGLAAFAAPALGQTLAEASSRQTLIDRARPPAAPPPGFAHRFVEVAGLRIHYLLGGSGPPVVLLHGWPQSSYAWRRVAPLLARSRQVIVPDLRGFGDSGRPRDGYDTRAMAGDVRGLLASFGHAQADVVGTDMGEAVAFATAAFHPDAVRRLALCEMVVPGFGTEELAPKLWHWGFLRAGRTPEILVEGRERAYLADHFGPPYLLDPAAIGPADLDEYARVYSQPDGWAAPLRMYRALAVSEQQNRERIGVAGKLRMPVLAIGAERSLAGTVMESAARVATDMRGQLLAGASHYIAEEKPDELAAMLRSFLDG